MKLTDEDLRAVLQRAEEIQRESRQGDAWNAEVSAVLSAGEGVGLSRDAVQRALTEHVGIPAAPPTVGSMVWARSADGNFYLANVVDAGENDALVRFLRGGEQRMPIDAMRVAGFLPGEKLMVDWPMWGPAQVSVVMYDGQRQKLRLADSWGYVKTFNVADVWLSPPRPAHLAQRSSSVAWIIAGSGTIGALIGAALTLLLR